jgi:hypothetical protein
MSISTSTEWKTPWWDGMFPGAPTGDHSRVGGRERTPEVLSRTSSRNGVTISTASMAPSSSPATGWPSC